MKKLKQFTDSELYSICKKWGREALAARRRFAGLLPEVYRREMASRGWAGTMDGAAQTVPQAGKISQLDISMEMASAKSAQLTLTIPQNPPHKSWLKRRGYTCVYEFAARLAGMSKDQVNRVLQLDKRFSALPILRDALINGDVSVNKLARIASVATLENQLELLNKAEKLSKAALEIYVNEYRIKCGIELLGTIDSEAVEEVNIASDEPITNLNMESKEQELRRIEMNIFESNVLNEPPSYVPRRQGGVCDGHRFSDADTNSCGLQLDTDVEKELKELQSKGIDVNAFLRKCLEQRKLEIAQEKEKLAEEANRDRKDKFLIGKPASRHIPSRIRKIIVKEHGTKCSAPHCGKPAEHLHHEKPFAKYQTHDPLTLKPLCRGHHVSMNMGYTLGGLIYNPYNYARSNQETKFSAGNGTREKT